MMPVPPIGQCPVHHNLHFLSLSSSMSQKKDRFDGIAMIVLTRRVSSPDDRMMSITSVFLSVCR